MQINSIRVYAEVLEQGLDFKEYLRKTGFNGDILNIYTKKGRGKFTSDDSLVDRLRKVKDIDILLTVISQGKEYPLLLVEYSSAVPTDDHKMQRSDVYFWGAAFQVPIVKISPSSKGMDQSFGGGSRFNDEIERSIAYRQGAILYLVSWEAQQGVLQTKEGALSCIEDTPELFNVLKTLVDTFLKASSPGFYYQSLMRDYARRYSVCSEERLRSVIVDSTRFCWDHGQLAVKINRFGHAMDPDRGVLYFVNMLVGAENTIVEIQVNRGTCDGRGGYGALFDALSCEKSLMRYVKEIISNQDNRFTEENAMYVFLHALQIENYLELNRVREHLYTVEDKVLRKFLSECPKMTAKCLFLLAGELRLTGVDREVICSVRWNLEIVREYLSNIRTTNVRPVPIVPLTMDNAKEDIVTFASVELYKRMHCNLLAVSYPGAQGDRCILVGQGRKVLRTYVDIIAYKPGDQGFRADVYLEECKDSISKSNSDVRKLHDIRGTPEKAQGLALLLEKITGFHPGAIYVSIGAKTTGTEGCYSVPDFNVDYLFMFSLEDSDASTMIHYSVAIVNTDLLSGFLPLAEDGMRLRGTLKYDRLYVIQ